MANESPPPSLRVPQKPRSSLPQTNVAIVAPHAKSGEDVQAALSELGFDFEKGLSGDAVDKLRDRFGFNELPKGEKESLLLKFLEQFANPFVGALLGAAAIAVLIAVFAESAPNVSFLARYGDAIAILLIVTANAVLGFIQEVRAEKALDALQKLSAPMANVVRGGQKTQVPARELVPGDLVELTAGDLVPADCRLLQAHAVQADESALTGESTGVGKDANAVTEQDAAIAERPMMVFLGTTITAGNGVAVVVATGGATELGKIGALMAQTESEPTPLEQRLEVTGKRILWACLAISIFLFAYGFFASKKPWHLLLLEAVSLAVAAIPEGLPAITTITLALGMSRMAERGAQVRKLPAVETLGSASVICSDKTGTLTQNEMTVREVWAGDLHYEVTGLGYEPDGLIVRENDDRKAPAHPQTLGQEIDVPLERLLKTAALCNNARFTRDDDGLRKVVGDPTEGALLVLAEKGGVDRESIAPQSQVIRQLPFDSDRKRMTVITLDETGRPIAHVKGGVDIILPRCTSIKMEATSAGDRPLDEAMRKSIHVVADEMANKALRVLALARRRAPEEGDPEEGLTFLGLVGMIDPPRHGAKKAIATAAMAGVRAVMITGDHKTTAEAIGRELGLCKAGDSETMTGAEIEAADDEELRKRVPTVRVFARVSAEHKLRIVRAFKSRGEVVAMTGDGVNDAPAIREAQIGIAMGIGGTDVAREAADLVLLDNDFSTIVEAIRQGRAIYRNIQKFIYFLLSSNAGLVHRGVRDRVLPPAAVAHAAADPLDQPGHQRPPGARPRRGPARFGPDARTAAPPLGGPPRQARVPRHGLRRRGDGRRRAVRALAGRRRRRVPVARARHGVLDPRGLAAVPRLQLPLEQRLHLPDRRVHLAPVAARRRHQRHDPFLGGGDPGAAAGVQDPRDVGDGVAHHARSLGADRAGRGGRQGLHARPDARASAGAGRPRQGLTDDAHERCRPEQMW